MKILFHREFDKSFKKLSARHQVKTLEVIKLFATNPQDPTLKNHALMGRMRGLRSISVTGNYRIIFEERKDGILIIMLDVGPHEQVYN